MLTIKRVYEPAVQEDGYRILVDRIWPRGLTKEHAQIAEWLKAVAPSTELRKWFAHDPAKFPEFKSRYLAELRQLSSGEQEHLRTILTEQPVVTLVYGAKDPLHNQAVVLQEWLQEMTK